MYDAIELEKRGVPTVVLATQPFLSQARAMARVRGLPQYQVTLIPHPVGSLDREGLRGRAMLALPQVLKLLLAK